MHQDYYYRRKWSRPRNILYWPSPADAPPEREALDVGFALARQCPDHRPRLAHDVAVVATLGTTPQLLAAMADRTCTMDKVASAWSAHVENAARGEDDSLPKRYKKNKAQDRGARRRQAGRYIRSIV
jgi:hypothetical protein